MADVQSILDQLYCPPRNSRDNWRQVCFSELLSVPMALTESIFSPSGGATKTTPAEGWGVNSDLSVYFAETASYTIRTPTRVFPTGTGSSRPSRKHNAIIIGSAVGGSIAVLVVAMAILYYWICRHRRSRIQFGRVAKGHPQAGRPSEMHGQITQPTELPSQSTTMVGSYKNATPSTSYDNNVVSTTRSSAPPSTGSPVESMPNQCPQPLSTNTVPAPLFNSRMGSLVYQHPAHQPLSPLEFFPPPPPTRSEPLAGSMLARPHTAHGRSHELPASKSPTLIHRDIGEMSAETTESASRSTYSLS